MKRGAKFAAFGVVLVFACIAVAPVRASSLGVLRGVVRDQFGAPLVGASVAIFDPNVKTTRPVRSTSTDAAGAFATQVAPGRYVLRAVAAGFASFSARARVAANQETVLDVISLRRANTLADRRRSERSDPYRNVVRSSRGHVFHLDELDAVAQDELDRQDVEALALTDRDNSVHGVVQAVAVSGHDGLDDGYVATNFAVAREVSGADLMVAGQVGVGVNAPRRLEARIAKAVGDDHELEVTAAYGRLRLPSGGREPASRLDQYTLQAVDRWRIIDPIVIVYGLSVSKFAGAAHASAIVPRFGIELSPSQRTQIFARLTPAEMLDDSAHFDLETGEVTFDAPDIPNVSAEDIASATPDRSRRVEFGVGHLIDERSNFEVMAFFDSASGRGIGFLAVPAGSVEHEFRTGSLDGRSSGVRVLYSRRFSSSVSGTIGYSAGTGLSVESAGLANPAEMFQSATFQMIAGRLEAEFGTGTRIAAVYRYSPDTVVFAIDPFAGRLGASEPAASFFLTQQLPMPDFIPGRWEAMVDVRNAFASSTGSDDGEILLVDYGRLIRAGVTFRF